MFFIFLIFTLALSCHGKEFHDKMDRYLISCHTTDFECFKRQYSAMRSGVLLGNDKLAISKYEPYVFAYGAGSCVKMSGWENSQMMGIGFDSAAKELTMALELPIYLRLTNNTGNCSKPEREFTDVALNGTVKEFNGNATLRVTFPFQLSKRKGELYLMLKEEEVDLLLDIPVYVDFEDAKTQALLNQESAWAYDIIQHIEAAKEFAVPFTTRIRTAWQRIPLKRLLLLYPEEEYSSLQFLYIDIEI